VAACCLRRLPSASPFFAFRAKISSLPVLMALAATRLPGEYCEQRLSFRL
jgi:hypothetical protein